MLQIITRVKKTRAKKPNLSQNVWFVFLSDVHTEVLINAAKPNQTQKKKYFGAVLQFYRSTTAR